MADRYSRKSRSRQEGRARNAGARSTPPARGRSAHAAAEQQRRERRLLIYISLVLVLALLLFVFAFIRYQRSGNVANMLGREELFSGQGVYMRLPKGSIPQGVSYRGIDLSGLSYPSAYDLLLSKEGELIRTLGSLRLSYSDQELSRDPYEMGLRLDIEAILSDANGIRVSRSETASYPLEEERYRVDEEALDKALLQLKDEIDQEGKDAKGIGFDFDKLSFQFEKEQEGRVFEPEANKEQLISALKKGRFDAPVSLQVKTTPPGKSAEELSREVGFVASASTPILSYSEARNHNVKLAADRIHGTILEPGESFSYNKTVGPMTEANGYMAAGVQDADGNTDMGVGGGLCQPSTTLYQAAVRSNMRIDVHNYHSTPVDYCQIGTDAMVSDWSDLVFTNTSDAPYAIAAFFDGSTLSFAFYGPPNPDNAVIDLYVEELDPIPPTGEPKLVEDKELPANETSFKMQPRPSRHVKVYRTLTIDGELKKSELIDEHYYPESGGVLAVSNLESYKKSISGTDGGDTTATGPTSESNVVHIISP